MSYSALAVFLMEIMGTLAFASSGALTGIRKGMDLFGINVLGIVTAVGGGVIRDMTLGINPPSTFQAPVYTLCAAAISTLLFVIVYHNQTILQRRFFYLYERVMTTCDSIGLSAFTVIGIHTAVSASYESTFLLLFVGMITGVGGGVLRDVLAGSVPYIFSKHVYAVASLVGALTCIYLRQAIGDIPSMIIGGFVIFLIRLLAARYRWNLPKIRQDKDSVSL